MEDYRLDIYREQFPQGRISVAYRFRRLGYRVVWKGRELHLYGCPAYIRDVLRKHGFSVQSEPYDSVGNKRVYHLIVTE